MKSNEKDRKVKYRVKLSRNVDGSPQHLWLTEKLEVMVFQDKDGLRVIASLCPHMGAQLQLHRSDRTVRCPWHGLTFDGKELTSGHFRYRKVCEYEGEVSQGELLVYGTY